MLNPLKFSITTPLNFKKYADRINGCSGILKFGLNPDQGKCMVLKQAFFAVSVIALCASGADLYFWAVMFQQLPNIQERFPTHRWVFLTLTVKNPPVRITWHFEAHEWFMAATDSNQAI